MGRGAALGGAPFAGARPPAAALGAALRAAIHDQPFAPDRHLEAEGAGMREAVIARRRRSPAVDQDQGAAGLQALKAAGRGALQRPLAAGGALQDQADLQILALVAAVEPCKAAVAVLQQAQHRGPDRKSTRLKPR